ncbi:hypothetical protein AL542_15765 [Grimontia hollisae]|uniref:hypothetical protein n=1 Tax=Grimontia hollisae TaxID=673 RepID=UPI0006820CD9|nr:hypothetical protein [Grimontia hollisae]AMG31644.1 hypothetical protein AL542_15765 [Grimontia hollisae]STO45163.1 Secreted effector protein sptP [Grimontia hollisae]
MIGPIKVTTPALMSSLIFNSLTRHAKTLNVVRVVNFRKQDKRTDFDTKMNFVKTNNAEKESSFFKFRQLLNFHRNVTQSRTPEAPKTSDVRALAREAALSGLNRALRAGKFDAETFKDQFDALASGNGSLRTMVTALQGISQFTQGQMKENADKLLSTDILGVKFSQFGTCSGPALALLSSASKNEMEQIISIINAIYGIVPTHLIGTEV